MKKKFIVFLICIVLCAFVYGCTQDAQNTALKTITDTLGRQVEINGIAQKVVAIGPGALRLCCYFNNPEIFVGIEQIELDNPTGRPYIYANPTLIELPVIGPGGPNNAPDPERLLTVKPDVIFTTYAVDKATADNLQLKTDIPVIALSYGTMSVFDTQIDASLSIIGETIGMEERASELIKIFGGFATELDTRTKDIADDKKPTAYIGALNMKGTHGIESTQSNYALFNAVNAKNVADETGKTGSIMIDREQLIMWDPDIIFIDGAGYPLVLEDYSKNPHFYKTLSAVNNEELYSILPYNFYSANIDTAIANAYYIGKILYPEQFIDIDPVQKADEIYKMLLGREVYAQMSEDFGGFKKVVLQ